MLAGIVDMLVDFVCEDKDILMSENHFCQRFQLILCVHAACRVARRAENQHARLRSNGIFQLFRSHFEILLEASLHDNGRAAGQFHHLRIAHPVGSRYNHLVAVVHQCHDGIADTLFGSVAHQYLAVSIVEAVLVPELGDDGLSQFRVSWNR